MNYQLFKDEYKKIRPDASEEEIRRGYVAEGVTFSEALGKGLGAGWYNTLGGFGTVGKMAGLPSGDWAEKQYQKAGEYALPEELQGYLWDKPELLQNPSWWAYQTGQVLPTIASSFLPGAAAAKGASLLPKLARFAPAIGAGVSGLSGGALEAAGTYRETGDIGQAATFGAASALLNAMPMFKILQGGSVPSRILKGAVWEAATEYAEEPTEALITGNDPIQAMKEGLNVVPGAFASALLMGAPVAAVGVANKALKESEKVIKANPLQAATLQEAMTIADEQADFVTGLETAWEPAEFKDTQKDAVTGHFFDTVNPSEAVKNLDPETYDAVKDLKDKSAQEIMANWRALGQLAQQQAQEGKMDKAAEILNNRRSYGIVMEAMMRKRIGDEKADYVDEVTQQFDEDVKLAIAEMMARPETHTINTPERQAMRTQISENLYGKGAKRKEHTIDIVIGAPASGKSTVAEDIAEKRGAIIIDSDMAKEQIPEYDGGMGANAVHQESKSIQADVLSRAVQSGDNIVMPIVGKDPAKVKAQVSELKKLGYNVAVHYVELPIEKSVERAVNRFRETGRFVSPQYINKVGTLPKQTYEALKNEQAADEFRAYSTDVPLQQKARILEEIRAEDREGRSGRGPNTGRTQESPAAYREVGQQRAEYAAQHKVQIDQLAKQPQLGGSPSPSRPAYSVLGNGIAKDFRETGKTKLLGKTVKTTHDLATLAQIYRDPRYETMRYFITNSNGDVVYQTGVTSRLPASTAHFVDDEREFFLELMQRMTGSKGSTLWLLHNHPSGNPQPSIGDVNVTRGIAHNLRINGLNFGGHVVINHEHYGVIDGMGNEGIEILGIPQDYDVMQPTLPHPILGKKILGSDTLVEIAKNIQSSDGYMTLIGRTSGADMSRVQLVAEISPEEVSDQARFLDIIKKLQLESGSADMFLTGIPEQLIGNAADYVRRGHLLDAIYISEGSNKSVRGDLGVMPVPELRPVGERVESERGPYGPTPVESQPDNRPPFVQAAARGTPPGIMANHAKRGTQDWQATEDLANALGTSAEEVDKFLRRNVGTAFNAEQLHQAANILTETWDNTRGELAGMVRKLDAGSLSDKDLVRLQEILHELNAMQAQYMGVRGEAGRALQIFRKLKEATKVADAAQQVVDAHGGRDMLEAKLRAIASLEDAGSGMKAIREEMEVTKADQVLEWYINSLVSGIPTHVVNMSSNFLVSMLEDVTRFVAAGLGTFHGGEKVSVEEAAAHAGATISGAMDGFKAFAEAIKDEGSPLNFRGKIDQPYRHAIPGTAGKLVRIPTRFLGAEDALFKTMAMTKELHALAVRESRASGIPVQSILKNPPKAMVDQAWTEGLKRTFTSKPGPVAQALLQLRRRHKLVNLIFPFVTTPANIVNYALKYTPVALGYSEVRGDIASGGAKRDIALARIATGSSIAAGIIGLAASGLISGAPPEDPNKRRLWHAQGNQPYSIKIGDTWYSYSRLEPVGMLFGISADMYRLAETIGTDEADKIASLIIGSVSNNLLSKTYLSGLSDMVNAMTDPERYGENWVKRMVTGFTTPVFLSYTAKSIDPNLREAETILEAIKARIPGLSQTLEPRLDVFGRERTSEGPAAYRFVSPAYIKKHTKDPVAGELLRLDVSMPAVGPKIQGVELTTVQRNELKKLLGQNVYAAVQRVIVAPGYKRLPDPAKAYVLDKVVSGVRRYGRLYWEMQHPEVMRQAQQLKVEEFYNRGG